MRPLFYCKFFCKVASFYDVLTCSQPYFTVRMGLYLPKPLALVEYKVSEEAKLTWISCEFPAFFIPLGFSHLVQFFTKLSSELVHPARVPLSWANSPTLGTCFSPRLRRADHYVFFQFPKSSDYVINEPRGSLLVLGCVSRTHQSLNVLWKSYAANQLNLIHD
eukprot:TRINITY_DN474_c0_g1_i9.p1 TRINITY_DN474_c0_g1~~TRINITY_DN474_c0_g1_i9.p1  ORF type:complete len:163 (-),score=4.55 TRINITY_DN474_c0_g1_i9:445-933(-)